MTGSGSPMMLTIRAKTGEIRPLRGALVRRLEAAAGSGDAGAERRAGGLAGNELEVDLALIAGLVDALLAPIAPGQPRELTGPTVLLDPVIREAASDAVERLREVVGEFRADRGRVMADEVRVALDGAHASVSTLLALDHVQNFGVE